MGTSGTILCTVFFILIVMLTIERGNSYDDSDKKFSRCGERSSMNDYRLLSRIVGGTTAKANEYPWMVSIRRKSQHVCGGAIVSDKHVVTAAHCVTDKNVTGNFKVCVGDHNFNVKEKSEQVFSILRVILHPSFLPNQPINYDISILVLEGHVVFGAKVQPVCLPSPDEVFPPGSLCIALGWGRISENGPVASILQQVTLPIVEHQSCMRVMQTLGPRAKFQTAICAGFPEGGKDACQGDSGGPFLCTRSYGRLVLVGVTSWGMGCARTWSNNLVEIPEKRGSPGMFTCVQQVLEWVYRNLNQERSNSSEAAASCSAKNQLIRGTTGTIKLPNPPRNNYFNNEKCTWTIHVPEEKHILLTFKDFDLEFDYTCDMDYLAVYLEKGSLIGKFCGGDRPRPLLITKNKVNLKFISDFQEYRSGFELTYEAVDPDAYPDSQCGSVSVFTEEGEIQTMNHPEKYNNYAECKWIITCPAKFKIKVTFHVFEVEPSKGCVFDYVLIYNDLEGIDVAGKFCGYYIPDPVNSTSNIMQIIFSSDSRVNHIGFRASVTFHADQSFQKKPGDYRGSNLPQRPGNRVVDVDATMRDSYQKLWGPYTALGLQTCDQSGPLSDPLWPKDSLTSSSATRWNLSHFVTLQNICPLNDTGCVAAPILPMFLNQSITVPEEAVPNSWPWHVSISFGRKHFCSGVIVTKTYVLTSAGCVAQKIHFHDLLLVVAGLHDLERSEDTQKCSVKDIKVHPGFVFSTMENDIALLQLKVPLQFNDNVRPVCFSQSDSEVKANSICVVTGWDLNVEVEMSTKLQQLEVPLESDGVCESFYGKITRSMSCAGTAKGHAKYTCRGQPGSPLVCPTNDSTVFFIYGIASRGVGCRGNTKPGAYTKVRLFNEWIQSILQEDSTEIGHHRNDDSQENSEISTADQPHQKFNSEEQPGGLSNSNSSESIYTECKGVVSLQSPGEIKLHADSQDRPNGFSCHLNVQAPANHFIMLNIKELHTSSRQNAQVVIYEGISSNKTLKAHLSVDNVPETINSTGPALTIEVIISEANTQLQLQLSYNFHSQN